MSGVLLVVSEKLREEMRNIETDLALGHGIKDLSDYKFACGRYRGLVEANGILAEVARQLENDDD